MSAMRIYLSHSSEDDGFCQALADALRASGAAVWYDQGRALSGQPMPGQLAASPEFELRARPVFLVILSPAALRSGTVSQQCTW
ncbi:MAG: toll/interleukin-1 receptor domain-containing protein, partial [Ktedonobacterales bacterium]|nr:toll/interleukin-1 receptor domain-containing protein [Ktedonobacterales bacterium]